MVDPGNPRGHWPLGRIQEVFPGPDGKVRVCTRQNRRERLCATNHKVVSFGVIKSTEQNTVLFEGEDVPASSIVVEFRIVETAPNIISYLYYIAKCWNISVS